jgi:hypothetical protein
MTRSLLLCASIFALAAAAAPLRAQPAAGKDDCETRIDKLDASNAEGAERLAEKDAVIGHCAREFRRDRTITGLVQECARYVERPVVKRQSVAECQLAAFKYGNALRTLKAWYRR